MVLTSVIYFFSSADAEKGGGKEGNFEGRREGRRRANGVDFRSPYFPFLLAGWSCRKGRGN